MRNGKEENAAEKVEITIKKTASNATFVIP